MNRILLIALLGFPAVMAAAASQERAAPAAAPQADIVVHKTPWCGCCGDWVEHLREHDLSVTVIEHDDLTKVRASLDVPAELASCHTADAHGYSIAGGRARPRSAGHAARLARHGSRRAPPAVRRHRIR
jgi:hypothetical protein